MSKTLIVHNHDAHFANLPFAPIILNDVPAKTKEERDALTNLIITTYNNTDTLEAIPTCSPGCGHLSQGYNLGAVCPLCGNRVENATDREIESNVWFRAPTGITSLINPLLWMVLSKYMTTSKYNVLYWFCNPYYEMPPMSNKRANTHIRKLEKTGIPRGINSFVNHFDQLIDVLSTMATKRSEKDQLFDFLIQNRDVFFPQHLPMPSKIAFVMENTATGTYADIAMRDAIDAVRTVTSIANETDVTTRRLEGKVASIIMDLSNYYMYMFGDPFSKKGGLIRHSVLGTRVPFSWRTVITSGGTTAIEDYETIKIPYSQAVTVFKVHLMNKLNRMGYNNKDAMMFIDTNTADRNEVLEALLYEIFAEAPGGDGVLSLFIRYPTLSRASIQALRINGITSFVSTLSIMTVNGPNADFDGDVLSGCIALSNEQIRDFEYFRPHYGIWSFVKLRTLNTNPSLPDVDVGVISHYFENEEDILNGNVA